MSEERAAILVAAVALINTGEWVPFVTLAFTFIALGLAILALRRANEAIETVRPTVDAQSAEIAAGDIEAREDG